MHVFTVNNKTNHTATILRTHLNPMTGEALTIQARFPVITGHVQFMNGVRILGSLPVTVPPGHSAN